MLASTVGCSVNSTPSTTGHQGMNSCVVAYAAMPAAYTSEVDRACSERRWEGVSQ